MRLTSCPDETSGIIVINWYLIWLAVWNGANGVNIISCQDI